MIYFRYTDWEGQVRDVPGEAFKLVGEVLWKLEQGQWRSVCTWWGASWRVKPDFEIAELCFVSCYGDSLVAKLGERTLSADSGLLILDARLENRHGLVATLEFDHCKTPDGESGEIVVADANYFLAQTCVKPKARMRASALAA